MAALRAHALAAASVIAAMGWDRTMIVFVILAGATALAFIGKMDTSATVGIYTAVLGYLFGRTSQAVSEQGGGSS